MAPFFNKDKKTTDSALWTSAYKASARFYKNPDDSTFGAFALTESTLTILPKKPTAFADNVQVKEWAILFIPLGSDTPVLGKLEYKKAIKELKKTAISTNKEYILLPELSLDYLKSLVNKLT